MFYNIRVLCDLVVARLKLRVNTRNGLLYLVEGAFYLVRLLGVLVRKRAHLLRDNVEARARSARALSLYGGVEADKRKLRGCVFDSLYNAVGAFNSL